MRRIIALLLASLLACAMLTTTACDNDDGPAERAGEKIDNAAEQAGESMKEAGEAVEQKLDQAGDQIKQEMGDDSQNATK